MNKEEIQEFRQRADALLSGPIQPDATGGLKALLDETGVKVLTRLVKDAREMLLKLQWSGLGGLACLVCGQVKVQEHLPDCRLKRFLKETEPRGGGQSGRQVRG